MFLNIFRSLQFSSQSLDTKEKAKTMNEGSSGSCLCGAVRFDSRLHLQTTMHGCSIDCRKSSETGQCTHAIVAEDAFMATGEITFYDSPVDSGNIVTSGFCGTCCSPLFSKNSGGPGVIFSRVTLLENPEAISLPIVVNADRATSRDTLNERIPSFAETAGG